MKISLLLFTLLMVSTVFAINPEKKEDAKNDVQYEFPFLNPELDIEFRVQDLISRMTVEEKVLQLFNEAPAIERLHIPAYNWWNECLHGVARAGKATVFPQAIGLAATFNETLMHKIGDVISTEGRAKHHYFVENGVRSIYTGLTFWSPNINIFRDPRWGRGQETYGEDPFLTGRMAVNFIKGIQGDDPKYLKAIATAKHYAVHSGPEFTRHSDNYFVNDRDLYETYLPAFEAAVKEANVQSVMCAYNRFRDRPCCGSDLLLQNILRNEFGFNGYVVSDCGAISDFYTKHHHELVETPNHAWGWAIASGTDLNCEENKEFILDNIEGAIENGVLNMADINKALSRLFTARFNLGMFDPQEMVPFSSIPYEKVGSKEHQDIAMQAAEESLVLLKNDGILPLAKNTKVALIGPNADNIDVLVGNYNGTPIHAITPLKAFYERLGERKVVYSPGGPLVPKIYGHLAPVPESVYFYYEGSKKIQGLKAEYFTGTEFEGTPALSRMDKSVNFDWDVSPISGELEDTFCVRWTGVFIPKKSGNYIFNGTADLKLDGKVILDQKFGYIEYDEVYFEKGKEYNFESKYIKKPHWWAHTLYPSANLLWVETSRDYEKEALEAAVKADVIVFCGGISPRLEGEEMKLEIDGFAHGDRTHINLPQNQEDLLKKLNATGKPVVYINFSGSAMALNWENQNLAAIIQAFYPGEKTGTALTGLLFGDYSPSGRLPVTFYKSIDDFAAFQDYRMENRTYKYFQGEPLYPFGYGLSYSEFKLENLQMAKNIQAGGKQTVSVSVKNTGKLRSKEPVQLYLSDKKLEVPVPIKKLVAFKNVELNPGESKTVNFEILPEQMAVVNSNFEKEIEAGDFEVLICGSTGKNQDRLQGSFTVEGNFMLTFNP